MSGDQLDLDLPREGACGYTLIDTDGDEIPCDRPGVSWRWYQGHDHEDMLDRACIIHENPGGIRMAALVAEVRRLRDLLETGGAEWTRMAEEHTALKSRADLSDEWCRRALAAEMTLEDLTSP